MSGKEVHAPPADWLQGHAYVIVESLPGLRRWLKKHAQKHAQRKRAQREAGVWLVTWKKHPGAPYVSRWDVLDELLCHGWIDGVRRRVDAYRTAQWASPRRHTLWTAFYRRRLAALIEAGRVEKRGLAAMDEAKRAGTWMARTDVDRLKIPADLATALQSHAASRTWFDLQAPSYRRNVLRWLAQARRDETRRARIKRIAQASAVQQRLRHF